MKKLVWIAFFVFILILSACDNSASENNTNSNNDDQNSKLVELGRLIFFDTNLSEPPGQSCSSCHDPQHGFADPDSESPTSLGANGIDFGDRNTPTAAYSFLSPSFDYTNDPSSDEPDHYFYVGGQFLDGRRNDLVEQAKDPFINPVEMANRDKAAVVIKVYDSEYADLFLEIFGEDSLYHVETAYHFIATAIAAFERSAEMNPFTSKFDYYQKGLVSLTQSELDGLEIFTTTGKCNTCHTIVDPLPNPNSPPSLFTNFRYFNIGVPKNPNHPAGANFTDWGLGGADHINVNDGSEDGKFKVSTLRNIELTAPYMHNGRFATLEEVVDFYNIGPDEFSDPPEVSVNISADVGFLELTPEDEAALVDFMKTLTDGYPYPAP